MTLGQQVAGKRSHHVRARRARRTSKLAYVGGQRRQNSKRRRRVRRKHEAAFVMDGKPLVRLPRLKLFQLNTRIPTIILLGLTLWALARTMTLSKFQIQEIRVQGTTFMSPARVRTIANVLGLPTYQVDPTEIESVLTSHPEIASADVRVGWPNDIDINVEEVAPALQWNDGGNPWLVSSEGIGFLHRTQITGLIEVYSSTPVLDIGDPSTPVIEPEKVQAALDLNAILGDDAFLVYDENLGFGFQDPHGWTAYFGFGGDMAKKYHAYSRIVIQLEQSGYPATIVSVEDLSTAYYR